MQRSSLPSHSHPRLAWLLAGVMGLLAIAVAGCPRKRPPPVRPPAPPPATAEAARTAVVAYLQDLEEGNWAAAYARLSAASRQRHSREVFTRQAQEGIVHFDLGSARAELAEPHRAEVTVNMEADPGAATITAVYEDGAWRVVYLGGRPGFPYPE